MKDFDHILTREMVCPYCGEENRDSWECTADEGEHDCGSCEKTYRYERRYRYSTERIGD